MKEYSFLSSDKIHNIHCVSWGNSDAKAILFMVHGMSENIMLYKEFSEFLSDNGFYFCGHDALGHGDTVIKEEEYGYFGMPDGNKLLLNDIEMHINLLKETFPKTPIFIMGHSMGSYLVRQYICMHSKELAGAIIMGTGSQSGARLKFALNFARISALLHGWKARNVKLNEISFGHYLDRIENPKNRLDWVSRDQNVVNLYANMKSRGYIFTNNGFYNMFKSIYLCQDPKAMSHIRKDFPMFFVSGSQDPVGNYAEGAKIAYNSYIDCGIKNADIKIYEGARHCIIFELNKDEVFEDILSWLKRAN